MKRNTARKIAERMLFAYSINGCRADIDEFFADEEYYASLKDEDEVFTSQPDSKSIDYIKSVYNIALDNLEEIDSLINKYLSGWDISRISGTARAIIRCAVCEILYFPDIPYSVSINEAVENAKEFEPEESVAFINGVLGGLIRGESLEK